MVQDNALPAPPGPLNYRTPTRHVHRYHEKPVNYWNIDNAHKIGRGSYGSVFTFTILEFYNTFSSTIPKLRWYGSLPVTFAVKIVSVLPGDRVSYATAVREIETHAALSTAPPATINGVTYDVASVVPKLFAAGYDEDKQAAVLCMEKLDGHPLYQFQKHKFVPKWVVTKLEYALACLYLNGYLHMDLHPGNVLVHTESESITLIDFGLAARLTPTLVELFRRYLEKHRTGSAVRHFWNDYGEAFGDTAARTRANLYGTSGRWFRNGMMLQRMIQRLAKRRTVKVVRRPAVKATPPSDRRRHLRVRRNETGAARQISHAGAT